ncbi:PHP domain-containing protein [Planctomycetales bacterium]|nr:PHP domain-containing protein [Planctomycetales bacterium]
MIDLHTHTLLSDGALTLAEHIRRAEVAGYRFLGISDHADFANLPVILPQVLTAAAWENKLHRVAVLAGVELTHVRPEQLADATAMARQSGADYVIVHGETVAEPVVEGTNRAAIAAGADILAHPGLITLADAQLAAEKGVMLEISGKSGHCLTNGHVAQTARQTGAALIFGSDAHTPEQMPRRAYAEKIMRGAGLTTEEIFAAFANAQRFAERKLQGK